MDVNTISEAHMTALTSRGYTKADLGMLAQTEIDALLAPIDETDPHETAAAEQEAGNATPEPVAADAQTGNVATDTDDEPFVPQYKAEVPADADEKLKTLRTEEQASFKRLMDGEIDAEEYQKIKARVDGEVDTLKTAALTASIFQQANAQAVEQAAKSEWTRAETTAMLAFKTEGLDYRGKPSLMAAYNVHLKALGADPKNGRRDAAWFLGEAHKLTRADLLGIAHKTAPNPAASGVDSAELPPTLRAVPAAATGAVNGDEFAHLRNLEGLALERAHAALSEDQRNRWMAE